MHTNNEPDITTSKWFNVLIKQMEPILTTRELSFDHCKVMPRETIPEALKAEMARQCMNESSFGSETMIPDEMRKEADEYDFRKAVRGYHEKMARDDDDGA